MSDSHPRNEIGDESLGSRKRARLSIVTPTFNSEVYLAHTLESVFSQNVEGLEHVVVDGGSSDRTLPILKEYEDRVSKIIVGKDQGQYDAINKGFAATSGEIMTWLNSDDVYLPSMLNLVVTIFERFPEIDWLTTSKPVVIAASGEIVNIQNVSGFSKDGFARGENLPGCGWPASVYIQQESTFWRRRLWEKAGSGLDLNYKLAGDFDLWARFFEHAELYALEVPIGCFRRHGTQRSAVEFAAYIAESKEILRRIGFNPESAASQAAIKIPGIGFFGRPWSLRASSQEAPVMGVPVVGYDWGKQDWSVLRR